MIVNKKMYEQYLFNIEEAKCKKEKLTRVINNSYSMDTNERLSVQDDINDLNTFIRKADKLIKQMEVYNEV